MIMSLDQYNVHFSAYIAEFQDKKCYVRPTYDRSACKNYCMFYYDYVPTLPYKNAQYYNPVSHICGPMAVSYTHLDVYKRQDIAI